MANKAKMESHAARVLNILESINTDIGRSGALYLIERAHRSPVPAGLSRTHSSFALRFLAEEAKRWDADLTPEEAAKRKAKEVAGRGRMVKQKEKAAERYQAGKGKKRKKSKKSKKQGPPVDGGDDAPPPPAAPGAGAQAVAADPGNKETKSKRPAWLGRPTAGPDKPEPSPIPDDDAVADRIKGKLKGVRKSRAKAVTDIEDPEDVYKTPSGRRQSKKAGLNRMATRRGEGKVGSGAMPEKTMAGASIHDKVAALQNTLNDLTQHVAKGRQASKASPFVRASRRQSQAHHPEDSHDADQHDAFQATKTQDLDWLEKERKRRGRGRGERGDADHAPRSLRAKASKFRRMQKTGAAHRDRDHDDAKGYDKDEHPKWAGHHKDPDTGENVHSSGKKNNKKFANATTFGNSDDDAMLHTDKDEGGSRGSAGDDQFAFVGDTDKDPRQKWYRVSKEGGYASAMASLGKSYHKDQKTSSKVVDKVKGTGFTDAKGHQIDVRPTGSLHDERPACQTDKNGDLSQAGQALQSRDPKEFYRLCKGSHDGPGGTVKGRSEYQTGFGPEHDDKDKITDRHKSAESGKADKPSRNIAQDAAGRRDRADARAAARG